MYNDKRKIVAIFTILEGLNDHIYESETGVDTMHLDDLGSLEKKQILETLDTPLEMNNQEINSITGNSHKENFDIINLMIFG